MSDKPVNEVAREQQTVAKGGVWSDENLEQSLDWQGETVGADASIDSAKTYTPKTTEETTSEILTSAKISPDVINAVTQRVERQILAGKSSGHNSLIELVQKAMQDETAKVEAWLTAQEKRIGTLTATQARQMDVRQADLDRLDEKIRVMEEKISALIAETTTGKTEEFAVLNEAAKILKDRRATEEMETESTPSIINRMELRTEQLNEQLRTLEPYVAAADRTVVQQASRPAAARRKFGKVM